VDGVDVAVGVGVEVGVGVGVGVGDDVLGRPTVQPATDSDAITISTIIAKNFVCIQGHLLNLV
jgi:hypothetical protein